MESTVVQAPVVLDSDDVFAAITWHNQPLELKISFYAVCLASEVWRKSLLHPMVLEEKNIASRCYSIDHEESDDMNAVDTEAKLTDEDLTAAEDIEKIVLPSITILSLIIRFLGRIMKNRTKQTVTRFLILLKTTPKLFFSYFELHIFNFDKIPSSLSFQELLEVARLCDFYQCPHLVRPWLPKWLEKENVESKLPGQEEWLLIAWVFGRMQVFTDLAAKMVREVTANESGQLVSGAGNELTFSLPPGIIESILEVRQATITQLLEIPYQAVDRYADHKEKICQAKDGADECDALVFRSLVRGLQKIKLWPRKLPSEIHRSVESLKSNLISLNIMMLRPEYPRNRCSFDAPSASHSNCVVPTYKEDILRIFTDIPNPVLDSHRRHMASNL